MQWGGVAASSPIRGRFLLEMLNATEQLIANGRFSAPARPTLAQDAARPQTPHGPGLPALRVRDASPWPKASTSICGETKPSTSRLQQPALNNTRRLRHGPRVHTHAPTKHMPADSRRFFVGGRRRTAQGRGIPSMTERLTVTAAGRLQRRQALPPGQTARPRHRPSAS